MLNKYRRTVNQTFKSFLFPCCCITEMGYYRIQSCDIKIGQVQQTRTAQRRRLVKSVLKGAGVVLSCLELALFDFLLSYLRYNFKAADCTHTHTHLWLGLQQNHLGLLRGCCHIHTVQHVPTSSPFILIYRVYRTLQVAWSDARWRFRLLPPDPVGCRLSSVVHHKVSESHMSTTV